MNKKGLLNQKRAKAKIKIFAFAFAMLVCCFVNYEKEQESNHQAKKEIDSQFKIAKNAYTK